MDDEPELISIPDCARLLSIGRSRAYQLAASGDLPGVMRLGRSLRVHKRRLREWLESQSASAGGGLSRE